LSLALSLPRRNRRPVCNTEPTPCFDAQEIASLRQANLICDAGFAQARESIRASRPEYEVALEIGQAMFAAGSEAMAVSGHFRTWSNRLFQPEDVVDVDLGGKYHGYIADTARLVFVGRPSAEVERMYRVTIEAFAATLEIIKPGVPAQQVHRVCAGYMAKHGYQQVWKVGYGIGLNNGHEAPLVEEGKAILLEPGIIFTVDPGCFLQGGFKDLPIHVESDILVTASGAEILTQYSLDMVIV
jgi:Xaa-Pro aminopeptidase